MKAEPVEVLRVCLRLIVNDVNDPMTEMTRRGDCVL